MKRRNGNDIFSATNTLKILSFLVENPGKELLGSEIQKATSISRSGVYIALRDLIKQKLVLKIKKGKFLMYSVVYDDPVVKQFKVIRNIQSLRPLLEKIKGFSKRIILYGSASRGEDEPASDMDLFILSNNPDEVKNIISEVRIKRKMQAVIRTPSELADFQDKEEVYYDEVKRGVILWEEKE